MGFLPLSIFSLYGVAKATIFLDSFFTLNPKQIKGDSMSQKLKTALSKFDSAVSLKTRLMLAACLNRHDEELANEARRLAKRL